MTSLATSEAAATPVNAPKPLRIQVPTLIGEVSLSTRSMFRNRSGRPRSLTSAAVLTPNAPSATSRELRCIPVRPVISAPAATRADPAASPPV